MKNKGFGHLKTRLFTIKTSKNLGIGGPWLGVHPIVPWDMLENHLGEELEFGAAWMSVDVWLTCDFWGSD